MNIRDLVITLEKENLIILDDFGRKYSEEYLDKNLWWNSRKNGLQRLRDDGSSSCGVRQRIFYNLETSENYSFAKIENLGWSSTLCYTGYAKEETLCLIGHQERKAVILEQKTERVSHRDTEKTLLAYGPCNIQEVEGILEVKYMHGENQVKRRFKGLEEIK